MGATTAYSFWSLGRRPACHYDRRLHSLEPGSAASTSVMFSSCSIGRVVGCRQAGL